MTDTENRFKSVKELKGLASRQAIGQPHVGAGPRLSLPVPVRREGQVQMAFMLCFFTFRPGWSRIQPPDKVASLDPVSGKMIALTQVSPTDFGQTDTPYKFIESDVYLSLEGITIDELDEMKKRLYALYEVLYKTWAINPSIPDNDELKNEAREFLNIFNQTSEQPLRPYYEALGRDWFGWLRELAK